MDNTRNGSKLYLYGIVSAAVLGGLLFGYDTAVISGAEKGLQAFFLGATDFQYTDFMHGLTCSSALVGCVVGALLSGLAAVHLGRKRTLVLAGVLFFVSALGSMNPEFLFFHRGEATLGLLWMFNFYRVVGGMGVGLASAVCPMYIGEVSPADRRGQLVSWNQFAIIFGQLVVYFVNFLILGSHTNPVIEQIGQGVNRVAPGSDTWTIETGWRYMFGSEAVPAALFTVLICLVPESPRWLAMNGRDGKALAVLSKIGGPECAKTILDDIKATAHERRERLFAYGWLVVFIGVMLSVFQQVVGINAVLYYAPRIFGDMGMTNPMFNTVMMGLVNIAFTVVAILTVERWGRKPLLISGSLGMAAGALGVALTFGADGLQLVTMISIMLYSASFMFSWGPVCWVLISEIFPNTIRGTAVAIAVAAQWIFNFVVSSTFVPMFNMHLVQGDDFGHWFTYGLYGMMCLVAAVFVWRLVPETKGKTLEDMTRLWKKGDKE
ncbi:MAG: D-xylose transporter XylE [Bacteroidales bacterium]|nr:D-xylose transporter XylE [Bacteroidales bacterium]